MLRQTVQTFEGIITKDEEMIKQLESKIKRAENSALEIIKTRGQGDASLLVSSDKGNLHYYLNQARGWKVEIHNIRSQKHMVDEMRNKINMASFYSQSQRTLDTALKQVKKSGLTDLMKAHKIASRNDQTLENLAQVIDVHAEHHSKVSAVVDDIKEVDLSGFEAELAELESEATRQMEGELYGGFSEIPTKAPRQQQQQRNNNNMYQNNEDPIDIVEQTASRPVGKHNNDDPSDSDDEELQRTRKMDAILRKSE